MFLDVTNYDVNCAVSRANHSVEDAIGEPETITVDSYKSSKNWTINETCTHTWTM